MPDLVLFPYLTLDARVRLGPWELIPRHLFIGADAATPDIFEAARKHIGLYRLPTDDEARINRCGCFARPSDSQIGAPIDRSGLRSLHLALVAALLDQNPSRSASLPNAAHSVSTSDNCLLFGHPINADGSVAVDYGFMVNTILGGLHAGDDPGAIFHPAELHLPLFGSTVDAEYGDRLYGLLTREDDLARRLATAIEWLDLAWRNTNSIHKDTRIVALRSG